MFNIKDNNLSSTNLHDPFMKQAKYKLKKYYSKDFFEFLRNLKRIALGILR